MIIDLNHKHILKLLFEQDHYCKGSSALIAVPRYLIMEEEI
jgi:hypothetical protein